MRRLQYLTPYMKIDIIYEHIIHPKQKKEISDELGLNYPTVLTIIQQYMRDGRIFKLLPHHSKLFLLKSRVQSIINLRRYKEHRKILLQQKENDQKGPCKLQQYRWIGKDEEIVSEAQENNPIGQIKNIDHKDDKNDTNSVDQIIERPKKC